MPKQILGIELGAEHVAVAQVTGSAKAYSVTAAVARPVLPSHDADDPLRPHQEVLETLLDTYRLRGGSVVASVPAAQTVMRNLTLPFRDTRRIRQVIKYTMDEHMPFDPDDVVADFRLLPGDEPSQTRVFAVAAPQAFIAHAIAMLNEIGLEPILLDVDVLGLSNAARLALPSLPERALLVDVQAERTLLTLHDHGQACFARSWSSGWPRASGVLETYAARMGQQLQRTAYAYENALQKSFDAECVVLSGAPDEDAPTLAAALEQDVGAPVQLWPGAADAWRGQGAVENGRQTVVALGLALRGLHRQAAGFNLRREQFALHQELEQLRGRLVTVGCMLVGLAAMGIGSLYLDAHFKAQRLQQLRTEISQIFQAAAPNERPVQPALQMQEKVKALQDKLSAFEDLVGGQLSGLDALREISDQAPGDQALKTLNIDSFTYNAKTIDISGAIGQIEDVQTLKDALEASSHILEVKINSIDPGANQVKFRLTLTLAKSGDAVT